MWILQCSLPPSQMASGTFRFLAGSQPGTEDTVKTAVRSSAPKESRAVVPRLLATSPTSIESSGNELPRYSPSFHDTKAPAVSQDTQLPMDQVVPMWETGGRHPPSCETHASQYSQLAAIVDAGFRLCKYLFSITCVLLCLFRLFRVPAMVLLLLLLFFFFFLFLSLSLSFCSC